MEFLFNYGLFLAKTATLVVAIIAVLIVIVAVGSRQRREGRGHIEVTDLGERYDEYRHQLEQVVLDEPARKLLHKAEQKAEKLKAKAAKSKKDEADSERRQRLYVLDFDGDIKASHTDALREAISAVLTLAEPRDEVLVRLESGGGMVHAYGLAASQLQRIRNANIPLTVAVDKVAASGGYMMACIANRIVSAPFAVIGSIGVMAQIPNIHRLLKKHDIDVELHTAGEFKRTLTVLGENTERGRQKFLEELEQTHQLFKQFVAEHRPQVEIDSIATGEIWYGSQALSRNLVDELVTSDEYLMSRREGCDIYQVSYVEKRHWQEKLGLSLEAGLDRLLLRWLGRAQQRSLNSH